MYESKSKRAFGTPILLSKATTRSQFGIGIVAARIAEIVLRDERAVIPIGSYNDRFGVTLSLPSIVGQWRSRIFEPEMSAESTALELSAANLRKSERRNQKRALTAPGDAVRQASLPVSVGN
jgi:L-lactate dehydrogenase